MIDKLNCDDDGHIKVHYKKLKRYFMEHSSQSVNPYGVQAG